MKRRAILLTALMLAGPGLVATNRQAGAAPKAADYVVVDPLDLRKPVPDPELGLTEKYDGKVVRFTGVLHRVTIDKKTRKYRYELRYVIVNQARVKGQKATKATAETIAVPVTFLKDQKLLRTAKRGIVLTVQGTGSVMVDGTLVISDAIIIPQQALTPKK
jgi:hypothetical protein